MNRLKHFIEWHVFGVCSAIGEKMGIATSTIRKYFIYMSFMTFGSPVIVYLFVAFWMNIKRYILNARRNPLRYLWHLSFGKKMTVLFNWTLLIVYQHIKLHFSLIHSIALLINSVLFVLLTWTSGLIGCRDYSTCQKIPPSLFLNKQHRIMSNF